MAGQVLQVVLVPSVLGQGQERVGLLWHVLEGRLSAGPLVPVAQYDCQQLAAVQLSLRSADPSLTTLSSHTRSQGTSKRSYLALLFR